MKIYIGADHRGFKIKEKLKEWLETAGYEVADEGNREYDPDDDFPDFALRVAEKVVRDNGVGILVCGSGGMAVAANKVKGIRAVEAVDLERAVHAKSHDHANVLTLSGDITDENLAVEIVRAWLEAPLLSEEKYLRRLDKIEEIERKYCKD